MQVDTSRMRPGWYILRVLLMQRWGENGTEIYAPCIRKDGR
jgi:hypothetical protein